MHRLLVLFVCLGYALGDDIACDPDTQPRVMDATTVPVVFSSPGFNFTNAEVSEYGVNQHCEWLVTGDPTADWGLTFFNFSVEACSQCGCDYVNVHDGTDATAPLVASLCTGIEPPLVSPTGDSVFIVFHADDYDTGTDDTGFLARVGIQFNNRACDPNERPVTINDTAPGFFSTLDYPVNYPANSDCRWNFVAPAGQRVQVEILEFELEDNACDNDNLEVHDGPGPTSLLIGNFYGDNAPPVMTSSGNEMYMAFTSDGARQFQGFFGLYSFV